jgi:hypothetical protein
MQVVKRKKDSDIATIFAEYYIHLKKDDSITIPELEAKHLNINPGDGFMAFVNPVTQEVTLKKVNLLDITHINLQES